MKSFSILTFYMLFLTAAFSQTEKGQVIIGNNSGILRTGSAESNLSIAHLSYSNYSSNKRYDFIFSPSIGYFWTDNFSAGLKGSFAYSRIENPISSFSQSTFALGPEIKYFKNFDSKFMPYFSASALFGQSRFKAENFNDPSPFQTYTTGAGVAYFLNKNVSINTEIFYQATILPKGLNNRIANRVGLDIGVNFFF